MSRFIFSSLQEHDANELACEIVLSILSMPGIAEDLAALAYRIGFEPKMADTETQLQVTRILKEDQE